MNAIRQGRPEHVPMPSFQYYKSEPQDPLTFFINTLTGIGGSCKTVDDYCLVNSSIDQQADGITVNAIKELPGYNIGSFTNASARELENVQTFIVKGSFAVAESGAVWINEKSMVNRLLPFISRQLVIVVEEKNIVDNLHKAYELITVNEEGYGVFIAGPSKTADIEQALVIGAHGPLSLQVFIIKDPNKS